MQSAYTQSPAQVARALSLPVGEQRNAGLGLLASRYQGRLELYIRCELAATRWSQHLDAQDLVQALYLKLLTVEPQEQIRDESHLVNWLQCVLRNHMLEKAKALKARKRDVSRATTLPEAAGEEGGRSVGCGEDRRPHVSPRASAPPDEAARGEDLCRYRDLLDEMERFLEPGDWDLFRRHHLEGVAQSVLAGEIGRTPGAVCQRLKRACAALRERFPSYADLLESF